MFPDKVNDTKRTAKTRHKCDFCYDLLRLLEDQGDNLPFIRKELKLSQQGLYYHVAKLKRLGLVQKAQSRPFSIYELTPLGVRYKKILVQSDKHQHFGSFRVHAKIIGFPVLEFGSFKFSQKASQMNGWKFEIVKLNYGGKVWSVHVQTTGLLKIYCPEVYTDAPEKAITELDCTAARIAERFREIYGMKLADAIAVRPAHKELVKSEVLAKLIGKGKFGDVWVDNSTGTDWVEEAEGTHKIEELFAMPAHLVAQTEIMDQFSKQMALHLDVLTDMKETLKKIREELSR